MTAVSNLKTEAPPSTVREVASEPKKTTPAKIKNAGTIGWFQQSVHRSRSEIVTEVKVVTPGLAEAILVNNEHNRPVRASKYAQLVSDMKAGRWAMNGEPIIIAKTGELNDGQHRLMALVEAKAALPMLFVFGVDRETRTTVDQGASRTAGDYLKMGGIPNGSLMAAIGRMLIAYERVNGTSLGSPNRVTSGEILERGTTDRTLATSAVYGQRHQKRMKRYATSAVIGFCHNILLAKNSTEGLAFMEMLCRGEGLVRTDPAFRAREKLLNIGRASSATKIEIIVRAWNAYREKRALTTIPVHGRLPPLV